MPWVRFLSDHDDKPLPQVTVAYRAGEVKLVTTACAERAIALGRAEKTKKPGGKADAD